MHESASEIEGASAANFEPGSVPRYVDDVSPGLEIAAGLFFSDPDGALLSSCLFSMNHEGDIKTRPILPGVRRSPPRAISGIHSSTSCQISEERNPTISPGRYLQRTIDQSKYF